MTQVSYVYVVFYRPCQWWGWLIAGYQFIRGVRYWQLTHCELMTAEGMYAYRLDDVLHGVKRGEVTPSKGIRLVSGPPSVRYKRSRKFHRRWGDFSPISVLTSRHCVKYVTYVLNEPTRCRLPGALAYELEAKYEIN